MGEDAREDDALQQAHASSHYKQLCIEPLEYIYRNNIAFVEGCIIKYVSRWRHKNGIDDLKKARSYLDYLIQQEEKRPDGSPS